MTDRTHDQGRVITEWYTVRMFWRAVGPCTRTVPVRAVFFCGRVIFHSAAKAETIDRRCGRAIAAPIRIAPSSGGPVRPPAHRCARARARRAARPGGWSGSRSCVSIQLTYFHEPSGVRMPIGNSVIAVKQRPAERRSRLFADATVVPSTLAVGRRALNFRKLFPKVARCATTFCFEKKKSSHESVGRSLFTH